MRYKQFSISHYRGIIGPLIIDVDKNSLVPIIGVNECGKTTILQAIFAFDPANDQMNGGRHLRDTENLYKTARQTPVISALVELTHNDLLAALSEITDNTNVSK